MQPAVLAGIGQRFIAGVDNGAIELHPFKQVVVDVIGALADLEMVVRARADQVAAQLRSRSRSNPAGTDIKLPERKKSQQRQYIGLGQRSGTAHQIIFMATESGARVVLDVVADEADLFSQAQVLNGLDENGVASAVVAQHVD